MVVATLDGACSRRSSRTNLSRYTDHDAPSARATTSADTSRSTIEYHMASRAMQKVNPNQPSSCRFAAPVIEQNHGHESIAAIGRPTICQECAKPATGRARRSTRTSHSGWGEDWSWSGLTRRCRTTTSSFRCRRTPARKCPRLLKISCGGTRTRDDDLRGNIYAWCTIRSLNTHHADAMSEDGNSVGVVIEPNLPPSRSRNGRERA